MTLFDWPLIGLALLLGFSLSKASLCAVACMKKVVLDRQYAALTVLGFAISAAGVVLLMLAVSFPQSVMLPQGTQSLAWSALGGVVLGLGSLVNGGCYLGSVTYLGRGNGNYLLTLVGIVAGLRLGGGLMQIPMLHASSMHATANLSWIAGALLFSAFISVAGWRELQGRALEWPTLRGPWPVALAACCSGLLAGAIYAFHPGWSYGTVLDDVAHWDQRTWTVAGNVAALALLGGVVLGTALSGGFKFESPTLSGSTRRLAGGVLLGVGSKMIPGGSDMLVLWAVPGLASYGVVAFGTMLVTIGAGFALVRLRSPSEAS